MRDEHKWTQPYRHFNTFSGDPIRALLTATQNKVIIEEKLVEIT
jgi:4-aminobutyrate aminotransferase-like enzyme